MINPDFLHREVAVVQVWVSFFSSHRQVAPPLWNMAHPNFSATRLRVNLRLYLVHFVPDVRPTVVDIVWLHRRNFSHNG
jgi:hypothetical protein